MSPEPEKSPEKVPSSRSPLSRSESKSASPSRSRSVSPEPEKRSEKAPSSRSPLSYSKSKSPSPSRSRSVSPELENKRSPARAVARSKSPTRSPDDTSKRVRRGRGFSEQYSHARRYRTPSSERSPPPPRSYRFNDRYNGRPAIDRDRDRYLIILLKSSFLSIPLVYYSFSSSEESCEGHMFLL